MQLCRCPRALRSTERPERLRCFACGGWTPYGPVLDPERLALFAREVSSLAAGVSEALCWDLSPHRPPTPGRSPGPSDPTGAEAADAQAADIRAWARVGCRLLERAVVDLRLADAAAGQACFAADGYPDLAPPAYAVTDVVPAHRPDLEWPHRGKDQRTERGEGHGRS